MAGGDDGNCLPIIKSIDWEVLEVPLLIQQSSTSIDVETSKISVNKDAEERLCGYLWKLGAKGLIKSWKHRWFVYDNRRCQLYYYRKPQDGEPLGNIDIANATFGFSADEKALFQISCDGRVYRLQANDRNTMMYWLQELQVRRRDFNKLHDGKPPVKPTSGLLGNDSNLSEDDGEEDLGMNEQVNTPLSCGSTAAVSPLLENQNKWNLSFSNLNKEFKNWRKSMFITGEPLQPDDNSWNDFGIAKLVSNMKSSSAPSVISAPVSHQNKDGCLNCDEASQMIGVLKESIVIAEREIRSRDEVIGSLSEQLRMAASEQKVEKTHDEEVSEERENYIFQLTRMVKKSTEEIKELKDKLKEQDRKVEEYAEKEKVFKEMIRAKDNSIVSLTNRVFSLEQPEKGEEVLVELNRTGQVDSHQKSTTHSEDTMNYNQLKEACSAYRSQNNFLNSEILELNRLRKIDSEKVKLTNEKNDKFEAEFLKLKSRYLCLLKELSSPQREGSVSGVTTKMVEHLIEDAINETPEAENSKDYNRFSDRYGFYDEYNKGDEESLEQLADHLDMLSGVKTNGAMEVSIGVKWENFLVAQGSTALTKTEDLKGLMRIGVPHEFRARVWKDMINLRISRELELAGKGYYLKLLKEKQGIYSPSTKQIELDLLRTLPNNKFYDKIEAEGTAKLRRILLAYSWHNPAVGYCQGLNRLGAIALLYLDEESAFWCLVAIIEHLMPVDYYSRTLFGAQIDQKVCRELIDEKIPKLGAHFNSIKFDPSLICFNWFLTVFVDFFPFELTLRVWDAFLFEGSKVLFRYVLAIFKLFEEDLLKLREPSGMFSFFRKLPKSRFQISKILHIAFLQMNPFSRRNIESKRRYYRPILQAQLDEFELIRREYRDKRSGSDERCNDPQSDDDEEQ